MTKPLEVKQEVPVVTRTTSNSYFLKESAIVKWLLITISFLYISLFLILPLISIFVTAFEKGWETYIASIVHPDALAAIKLTITVALIVVPLNAIFGIAVRLVDYEVFF